MTNDSENACCDDADLDILVNALRTGQADDLTRIDEALAVWPGDHRLWVLKGAVLAAGQLHDGARQSFRTALERAPGFAPAAFFLGLLEMFDSQPEAAAAAWRALDPLPADSSMRIFRDGMLALAENRFDQAAAMIERGLRGNRELPELNDYFRAVLASLSSEAERAGRSAEAKVPEPDQDQDVLRRLMLARYSADSTRH